MRYLLTILCALVLAGEVSASCSLQSARLSAGLIKVGDSDRRVVQSDPERTVRLETAQGGAAGHRFDFYQFGQTLQVYVQAGRVVRICRVRD